MSEDGLISIGEFSSITGVSIHSLRYYDKIGVLRPELIDPVSNYRYYSYRQLSLMHAISICKDAGIKLSSFSGFLKNDSVDYNRLCSESLHLLEEKIISLKQKQDGIHLDISLLKIQEALMNNPETSAVISDIQIWKCPCKCGSASDVIETLSELSVDARRSGASVSPYLLGLMKKNTDSKSKICAFSRLTALEPGSGDPDCTGYIEGGKYLFRKISGFSLAEAEKVCGGSGLKDDQVMVFSFICDGSERPLCCAAVRLD